MGWAKQDLPTREEIAVDCSSRREGSTLERVEKEAPGRGIRRNYTYFGRERPTSYYPSDPRPCMLSETRKVAPGRAGCVFFGIGWVHVGSHRQQQTCLLFLSRRTWKMRDWLERCSIRGRERGPSWGPVWRPSFMTTLNDKDTTHAGQAKHFGSTTQQGSLLGHHQEAVRITSEQKQENFQKVPHRTHSYFCRDLYGASDGPWATSQRSPSSGEPITERRQVDYSVRHFLPFSFPLPLSWREEEKEKAGEEGWSRPWLPFPLQDPELGERRSFAVKVRVKLFIYLDPWSPNSESPLKMSQSIKKTIWICLRCLQWAGRDTPTEQDWKHQRGNNEVVPCVYISEFRGHSEPYSVIIGVPQTGAHSVSQVIYFFIAK